MTPEILSPVIGATANAPLPKDLEGACRAMEKEFATLVFQKMRQAMVPKSSSGSSGFARETTQSMLDAQWAQLATQGEGLGLWRVLYQQLEPRSVKSQPGAADQRGEEQSHRKEADHHVEAKGSAGAPSQHLGSSQTARAQKADPGVPGLSGSLGFPLGQTGVAKRKGL